MLNWTLGALGEGGTAGVLVVLGTLIAALVVRTALCYVDILRQVRGVPTIHCVFETFESPFRSIVPHTPFLFPSRSLTIDQPFKKYADAKSDLIALTQLSSPYALYSTASPTLAASIFAKPSLYLKATEAFRYKSADGIFGKNIVTAQNGAEHRRHRNVIKGCFGEATMRGVWSAAEGCAEAMVRGLEVEDGGVVHDWGGAMVKASPRQRIRGRRARLNARYTLLILGKAGFGQHWPWSSPAAGDSGGNLSDAFDTFERTIVAQTLFPLWLLECSPIPAMRAWGRAQRAIHDFIDTITNAEPSSTGSNSDSKANIISALIAGQAASEKGEQLTRKEVYANVMMFIFAGHETTAHALTFLISFIIAHPEVQERMYAEIIETDGTYANIHKLRYCLNGITETVRLRDSIQYMSKRTSEDVTVTYNTWTHEQSEAEQRTHTIKAGSRIIVDSPACSVNPIIYKNPSAFKPERWSETAADGAPADLRPGFTGFAQGQRVCIGKRFAEVEMLSFLNTFIRRYSIEPVYLPGETQGEWSRGTCSARSGSRWDRGSGISGW